MSFIFEQGGIWLKNGPLSTVSSEMIVNAAQNQFSQQRAKPSMVLLGVKKGSMALERVSRSLPSHLDSLVG